MLWPCVRFVFHLHSITLTFINYLTYSLFFTLYYLPFILLSTYTPPPAGGAEVVAGIERCVGSFLRQHSSSLTPPPQLAAAAASLTLCHALLAGTVTTLPLDDAGATASTTNSNVNESGMSLPSKNNAYNNNNTNFNGIDATKSIGSDKASSREAKVNHKECASSLFTYLLTTQRIRDE